MRRMTLAWRVTLRVAHRSPNPHHMMHVAWGMYQKVESGILCNPDHTRTFAEVPKARQRSLTHLASDTFNGRV